MSTPPSYRNGAALSNLSRSEIQRIARREKVRANGKTGEIIMRLLKKYPEGVPRDPIPGPVALNGKTSERKVSVTIKSEPEVEVGTSVASSKERRDIAELALNGAQIVPATSPAVPTDAGDATVTQVGELFVVMERTLPKKIGPSKKDVRYIKRELSKIVNAGADIPQEIDELEILLAKAADIGNEINQDMKEIVWMRFCLEADVMRPLKGDQTLWDGTRLMRPEPRKKWEKYLAQVKEEEKEKERREAERREQEEAQRQRLRDLELDSSDEDDSRSLSSRESIHEPRSRKRGPEDGAESDGNIKRSRRA